MNRRDFLGSVGAGVAGSAIVRGPPPTANASAADRVSVAMMGVNGRGRGLTGLFASLPDVEIPYISEVDSNIVVRTGRNIRFDPARKQF